MYLEFYSPAIVAEPRVAYRYQPYPVLASQKTSNPNGSPQTPYFVQVLPGPHEDEDRLDRKSADTWLGRWTTALFFATFFLFAATGVLGWFAWRQAQDTKIVQRARLSAIPRGIYKMTDGTYIAHIAFQNIGNLPAKDVRNQVNIRWFADGNKSDFDAVTITEPGAILLLPKVEVEWGTGALSKEDAEKFDDEEGFVFVWERLEYQDGFDHDRWLTFCHRYNCKKPDVFRHHHHHNYGD